MYKNHYRSRAYSRDLLTPYSLFVKVDDFLAFICYLLVLIVVVLLLIRADDDIDGDDCLFLLDVMIG